VQPGDEQHGQSMVSAGLWSLCCIALGRRPLAGASCGAAMSLGAESNLVMSRAEQEGLRYLSPPAPITCQSVKRGADEDDGRARHGRQPDMAGRARRRHCGLIG